MEESNNKKIDLNLADLETLQKLPGVGPKMAQLIQESRPYASAEDLQKVSGIGLVAIERWRDSLIFPASNEPTAEEDPPQAPQILAEEMTSIAPEIQPDDTVPMAVESQNQGEGSVLASVESQIMPQLPEPVVEESEQTEQTEPNLEPVIEPFMEAEEKQEDGTAILEVAKEEPPAEEATPAPSMPTGWISRSQAFWGMVITGFAAIILAVALSLGILAGMNGGLLQFAAPSQVAALTTQAKGLDTRVNALEQDAQGLRARLDNLEGMSSRINTVENATTTLQEQMKSVTTEIDSIEGDIGELQTQIEAVSKLGEQFTKFLESLQSLLNDMLPLTGVK